MLKFLCWQKSHDTFHLCTFVICSKASSSFFKLSSHSGQV
eukprot:03252.XXX_9177_9296_1 [CDS] Oithona nana genome sequencing.